jgi:hypothetical protein
LSSVFSNKTILVLIFNTNTTTPGRKKPPMKRIGAGLKSGKSDTSNHPMEEFDNFNKTHQTQYGNKNSGSDVLIITDIHAQRNAETQDHAYATARRRLCKINLFFITHYKEFATKAIHPMMAEEFEDHNRHYYK